MPVKRCPVQYFGPSYPEKHGTRCTMNHPHPGIRHYAEDARGHTLWWWTAEEKSKKVQNGHS